MKTIKKYLQVGISTIILILIGTRILLSENLANSLFGWTEYDIAQFRDLHLKVLSLCWVIVAFILLFVLGYCLIRRKFKSSFFFSVTIVIWCFIGIVTTVSPLDREIFRQPSTAKKEIENLFRKPDFKNEDVELLEYGLYFRNPVLKNGVHAVTRVINPKTKLQDAYWYSPYRPIFKWLKAKRSSEFPNEKTILLSNIKWEVIPKIIKETEMHIKNQKTYSRGISSVRLDSFGIDRKFCWSVSVMDIRRDVYYTELYTLDGKLITSQWNK